jgi:hypothetical protein
VPLSVLLSVLALSLELLSFAGAFSSVIVLPGVIADG